MTYLAAMSDLPPPPPPVAPGYPAYPAYPAAPRQFRSSAGVAKALRVLVILTGVASGLMLVSLIVAKSGLDDYVAGSASKASADARLAFFGVASVAYFGLTIAVFVLTIIWQWRLAKNHQALGRPGTSLGPAWAIAGWFIPLAFYVLPFLVTTNLWKGSAPGLTRDDPEWKRQPVAPIVFIWWFAFCASTLVNFQFQLNTSSSSSDTASYQKLAESISDQLTRQWAATALLLVATVAYVLVIDRLTERQQTLIEQTH